MNENIQKYNYRISQNGKITVPNNLHFELPTIAINVKSGRTTYCFTGSYDGDKSLPSKLLKYMTLYSGKGVESSGEV